ncbi:helix-turn-helix domain-containing protein [Salinithrix halophila]|uniref:Helix-turn-helix domain-containing protein n=1 Tax=Salinithrix halophila TaxID=1485204 RepID=A0ABV8JCH2_9BACL
MSSLDIHEIGEVIRKVRKERGLRLEDLADQNISPATISNIERGVPHVNPQRATYLLKKLDIQLDELPNLMIAEQQELQNVKFDLFAIETMRDTGNAKEALQELKKLDLDDHHPCAATAQYLTGKCLNSLGDYSKAQRALFNAIRLTNQNAYGNQSNIEAASFTELGLNSYYQNDMEQALAYTESGIDAFVEDGERLHFKYVLLRNKIVYLERLGRIGEALKVVEDHWESITKIQHMNVVLAFYCWRAELLHRTKQFDNAIKYSLEGLEKARLDYKYNSMFRLWVILASIYMTKNDLAKAEQCFQLALSLKNKPVVEKEFTDAYTRLGVLYIKQKRWAESREAINNAVSLSKRLNDIPRLANALITQGDYYRVREEKQEAIPHYQEALKLAQQHKLPYKESVVLLRLAQCWENTNKKEFQQCLHNMYKVKFILQYKEVDYLDELL